MKSSDRTRLRRGSGPLSVSGRAGFYDNFTQLPTSADDDEGEKSDVVSPPKVTGLQPGHAQWSQVAAFLEDPKTRDKVSGPAAERLLEMHHQVEGFELPDHVVKLAAQRLGIAPSEAKARFHKEPKPTPSDAQSLKQLALMACSDIADVFRSLPMGPVHAVQNIVKETKDVLERTSQPHLSKAEKKELRTHFDRLHSELRKEMERVQTDLSKAEQARSKVLSDPTGEPIKAEPLDARGQTELKKIDTRIDQNRATLAELGNVGLALTTLRGESFWEQNWFVGNLGVDFTAFAPYASGGVGGVREYAVRDPKTGQKEVRDSASAMGLVTNGFARKVVSKEDLVKGNWKSVFSAKGSGAGGSPIPFVNLRRDPVIGDVIGVFVPGIGFAELNSRPDGKAGFGAGVVFSLPGMPGGPVVSANWNHPLFKPVVSRAIAPLSQTLGYILRLIQLGAIDPASRGADWVKAQFRGDEPEPNAKSTPGP